MAPVNIQPKIVLIADGVPEGPNHRPWSNARLNISAPKSTSVPPGFPNSGSANCICNKWFHVGSSVTGSVGIFEVIFGITIASTFRDFPSPLTRVISKFTIPRGVDRDGESPKPLILTL